RRRASGGGGVLGGPEGGGCAGGPGRGVGPGGLSFSRAGRAADPGAVAAGDRAVGLEPLAREYREDAPATDDDVRRLVAAGDRDSPGQLHSATIPAAEQELHRPSTSQYACPRGGADPAEPRPNPAPAGGAAPPRAHPRR